MTALLIPLMTSVVVRSYGWMILLASTGVVNASLVAAGIVSRPIQLLFTPTGVVIALAEVLLPFMVLSLLPVLQGVDVALEEASHSLGASPLATFRHIVLPLSLPGLVSGSVLVFVLSAGAFATPRLVGRPDDRRHHDVDLRADAEPPELAFRRRSRLGAAPPRPDADLGARVPPAPPRDEARRSAVRRLGGRRLLGVTNALIYLYLLAPILIVIPVSFSAAAFVVFPPRGFSLRWYVNFLQSRELTEAFELSLRLAVAVTADRDDRGHAGGARPRALPPARS